jgi:hypothetical protein
MVESGAGIVKRGSQSSTVIGVLALVGFVALVVLVARCPSDLPAPSEVPLADSPGGEEQISPWEPIFVGVDMCRASTGTPRPMQIRAVRVDLHEPTIDLLVTPSNGASPMDCDARAPSEFLSEFQCQVAINGSVFLPAVARKGEPQDVRGLSMSRGEVYSEANQFDALLISRDKRMWIDREPIDTTEAYQGLSGFYAVLLDGKNVGRDKDPHPRSAVGISRDGRYLILMTIDGRQTGYSEGATTREVAEWLRRFGARDGLNLDGGGSTALVIEGADGKPKLLNRPSGKYERRVANHLGVLARRLPADGDRSKKSHHGDTERKTERWRERGTERENAAG